MGIERVKNELEHEVTDTRVLNWGSIFAGTLAALGSGLVLLLFGNAIGLNLANTFSPGVSDSLRTSSWIYMFIALVVASYIGGYFSGRSSHQRQQRSGLLHGLMTWALATVIVFSVGAMSAAVVRILLVGAAGNSLNWLSFFGLTLGCIASAVGGVLGEASITRRRMSFRRDIDRRAA